MSTSDYLFWTYDWYNVVAAQKADIQKKIDRMTENELTSSSIDDLAAGFVEKHSLIPPAIDTDGVTVSQREIDVDVSHDRYRHFSTRGPHFMKGTAIDVKIPFTGDREMFRVKPNEYDSNPPRAVLNNNYLAFTVSGVNMAPEQVKSEIDSRIKSISSYLKYQKNSVGSYHDEIRNLAVEALKRRQAKLKTDGDLISGLGYKIE